MNKIQWNPWHGCHKCSPGCQNCYVYYLDGIRGKDAGLVTRSKSNFNLPIKKDKNGNFRIPSGQKLATCFTSDFFIEEADAWRKEAWEMIRKRSDVCFLICTKRVERMEQCFPDDWEDGYENVIFALTCETQKKADERLPLFLKLKAKHKVIFAAPLLEEINFDFYLKKGQIEMISVGGESYENARECRFEWVKHIKQSCDRYQVCFDFHQTGSHFVKDGKHYKIRHRDEYIQAKKGMEILEKMSKGNKKPER